MYELKLYLRLWLNPHTLAKSKLYMDEEDPKRTWADWVCWLEKIISPKQGRRNVTPGTGAKQIEPEDGEHDYIVLYEWGSL